MSHEKHYCLIKLSSSSGKVPLSEALAFPLISSVCGAKFSGHRSDSTAGVHIWRGHPGDLFQPHGLADIFACYNYGGSHFKFTN